MEPACHGGRAFERVEPRLDSGEIAERDAGHSQLDERQNTVGIVTCDNSFGNIARPNGSHAK